MSSETQTTTDLENEADGYMAVDAIKDYPNLHARQRSFNEWDVIHFTDRGTKLYRVNLQDRECECPDWKFNRDDPFLCKHMATALYESKTARSADQFGLNFMATASTELRNSVQALERAVTATEADAQAVPAGEGSPANPGKAAKAKAAETAAETLQEAFDKATSGMKAEAIDGNVWLNKSPEAPDWTFDAFLRDPDAVEYDPDNAPKDYFKNYIRPGDVEAYISEVLE